MRGLVAAVIAVMLLIPAVSLAAAPPLRGHWILRGLDDLRDRVDLELDYEASQDTHSSGTSVAMDALRLTDAQLAGAPGSIAFRVTRDAGTFACTGIGGKGSGAGTFEYLPSAAFGAALAARGIAPPTSVQSLVLAFHAITLPFVDTLAHAGIARPSVDDLSSLANHGVSGNYVAELAQRGYTHITLPELVELADHGVTTSLIDRLHSHGYARISVRDLIRLHDSGL